MPVVGSGDSEELGFESCKFRWGQMDESSLEKCEQVEHVGQLVEFSS